MKRRGLILMVWLALYVLALALPLAAFAQPAPAIPAVPAASAEAPAPRIGVVTMQPGTVFFERFGHDAIVVVDPLSGEATSYNFGYFDPSEDDFISRFARGDMMYYLVALPLQQDLSYYDETGRGASVQWLDLRPDQARSLAAGLAERAKPENARYHYDYYTANCATMVRDTLDKALGGGLQSQLSGRSRGNTYRSESVRLASPAPWMWLGFDVGLGPLPTSRCRAGRKRSSRCAWPMPCARHATAMAGRWCSPNRNCCRTASIRSRRSSHAAGGRGCCAAGDRRWRAGAAQPPAPAGRAGPAVLAAVRLFGGVLVFLWGFSIHYAAWANRNLLLLFPTGRAAAAGRDRTAAPARAGTHVQDRAVAAGGTGGGRAGAALAEPAGCCRTASIRSRRSSHAAGGHGCCAAW